MVKTVYLLRHGHIDHGCEKKYLGRTDVPLDSIGLEQACALQAYFKTIALDAILISPLQRCVQTAQILCEDRPMMYQSVEAFSEIDMGDWDNVPMAYIKSHYPKLYAQRGVNLEYFKPPNGESFHEVAKRARDAFDLLIHHASGSILIVAHAGVNRMILTHLLDIPIHDMFSIEQPYACINVLTWDDQTMRWDYKKETLHVKSL